MGLASSILLFVVILFAGVDGEGEESCELDDERVIVNIGEYGTGTALGR